MAQGHDAVISLKSLYQLVKPVHLQKNAEKQSLRSHYFGSLMPIL